MLQWSYWGVLGSELAKQAEERYCFKAQKFNKQMQHEGEPLFTFFSAHRLLKSNRCVGAPEYFILCRSVLKGVFPVMNPLAQCGLLYRTFLRLTVGEFVLVFWGCMAN